MESGTPNLNFHLSQLEEIDCRHLFFLDKTPVDLYQSNIRLELIKEKNELIDKSFFLDLVKSQNTTLYINKNYRHLLNQKIFAEITSPREENFSNTPR